MYSANDSFSQRSSHQRIVTRSPNHMWASSCRIVNARRSIVASAGFERHTYCSVIVTAPAFSIAPALNSGTNSWSYLANGYGCSNWPLEPGEPPFGEVEHLLGVQVFGQGPAAEHPERDDPAVRARQPPAYRVVRAGHERGHVRAQAGRRLRTPRWRPVAGRHGLRGGGDRDELPVLRRGHRPAERRLRSAGRSRRRRDGRPPPRTACTGRRWPSTGSSNRCRPSPVFM